MEILIFSDAHGRREGMQEAIARQVGRVDAVFFLGDGLRDAYALDHPSLYAVRGNCDWFSEDMAPAEIVMSLEGHTILATHGHAYGVKSGRGALIAHAAEVGADIVYSIDLPNGANKSLIRFSNLIGLSSYTIFNIKPQ